MLADRALDLLSAALRHVRDAETLATSADDARSLDQAFHLAGYGPECERDGADPERDAPAADDPAAAHHPSVIRFDQRLVRFSALRERRAELTGPDYVGVKERIAELCAPESDAQGEE